MMKKIILSMLIFLTFFNFNKGYSMENSSLLVGANLWQAIIWASKDDHEHLGRLRRELDSLKSHNVGFVRILASIQKHASKFSIQTPCQSDANDPGSECLRSLKIVLDELQKRDMKAIVVFNNFWHWSGGFNSYMAWTGEEKYTEFGPTSNNLTITRFFMKASKFYNSKEANLLYDNFIKSFFDKFPQGHPAILTYQLANEPTPFFNHGAFSEWVQGKIKLIKKYDTKTPLTLGGVGTGPNVPGTVTDLKKIYGKNQFDYLTVHLWPQNWMWYNPRKVDENKFQKMLKKSKEYLQKHAEMAKITNSPLLLEEFGLARDHEQLERDTTVVYRNRFYQFIISELRDLKAKGYPIAGLAFWAWGGEGIPEKNLVGDPPHEKQGWYSIFNSDFSTLEVIRSINEK
jgi:mannan endo-1,4-beta-mannosidase